jgi:type IV secretory pathway TrbD component
MMHPPPPRFAVLLGGWLGASFAWGRVVGPTLFIGALVAGILGLRVIAYFLLCSLVVAVAWVCAGCGVWLWLLAFAVFKAERRDGRVVSAYLRFGMWAAVGTFLVWCGIGAMLGFFLHWPFGYWPQGKLRPP